MDVYVTIIFEILKKRDNNRKGLFLRLQWSRQPHTAWMYSEVGVDDCILVQLNVLAYKEPDQGIQSSIGHSAPQSCLYKP